MTEQEQGLDIKKGDLVTISTPMLTLRNLIVDSAANYPDWAVPVDARQDCWYIECHLPRPNGGRDARYWKQDEDGGVVTIQEEVIN